jgi:peroxiredoxin
MQKKILLSTFLSLSVLFVPGVSLAKNDDGLRLEPRKLIAYNPGDVMPLGIGDSIPYGTLRSAEGKAVDLEGLLRGKATIFLFYQGGWSPSANVQLGQLDEAAPTLTKMGFQVVAVSPDRPSRLKESLERHHLKYPLFCDRTMEITRRFGVAYLADPDVLREAGVTLKDFTGNTRHVLPVPAVFGIDRNGIIRFSYFNADPREGLDPQALIRAARDMLEGAGSTS